MTDRDLLEKAAKAAGIEVVGSADRMLVLPKHDGSLIVRHPSGGDVEWNPLTDDGDALRLAVKLGIRIAIMGQRACAFIGLRESWEPDGGDIYAATRRAIVRAAAAIGEGKT